MLKPAKPSRSMSAWAVVRISSLVTEPRARRLRFCGRDFGGLRVLAVGLNVLSRQLDAALP